MADTLRVDLCYRPLRIGWAVREGDIAAFRQAVKYSHALWGGRFNPILVIDREDEARQLVELFRIDMIWPIGDSQEVTDFPKRFPHLDQPFFGNALFIKQADRRCYAQVLDVYNALVHWHHKPEWKTFKDHGPHLYTWQCDDPLADAFLVQLGAYPSPDEVGTDYRALFANAAGTAEHAIESNAPVPTDIVGHPGILALNRIGIERHYRVRAGWNMPGFFIGNASDLDDLICCWNLRACDIPLLFVDPAQLARYAELIPAWEKSMRQQVESRHVWDRELAVWSRQDVAIAAGHFAGMKLMLCQMYEGCWSGGSVRPPIMQLGTSSTLGVVGESGGTPRVNFALADKPFCDDVAFSRQHLVASVYLIGGLHGDEQHTFEVPYVPELNEVYAQAMHFHRNTLRVEPDSVGLVIDAADHNTFLIAMPIGDLVRHVFALAGFDSTVSSGGRILRQLMTQLGGLQGARVFKIPGARQLLKKFGPKDTFSREVAHETIRDKSPGQRTGTFAKQVDLFLGRRPINSKLTPPDVFTFMVEKGLFRIGVDLNCPQCGMTSWVALDVLMQRGACELCGHEYDATGQLVAAGWRFRRSGVLGAERNAQGAVPVALTLQQLDTNVKGLMHDGMFSPSLDLVSKTGESVQPCEVDFVWLLKGNYPDLPVIILGECKDQGPIKPAEFQKDVDNLRRVADAIPRQHFQTYVLFTKLAPFTPDEIAMARTLNRNHEQRVILLTARELEPYHTFEWTKLEYPTIDCYGQFPEQLARVTALIYFPEEPSANGAG
ncbi:hypothetical protein PQR46_32180 [Paraburkholderia sediminicola]|uniref:hypothetical protein n=1 Tax=Paraburkholderia sediminicola TaxID=458836 RepID=UPI0038B89F65